MQKFSRCARYILKSIYYNSNNLSKRLFSKNVEFSSIIRPKGEIFLEGDLAKKSLGSAQTK